MALDLDVVVGPRRTDLASGADVIDLTVLDRLLPASEAVAVLVLGMHRSGTSAVTRVLAALGLDPGTDPLMEATVDNPTGHFEVGRLTGFDDEVLDAVGGRWAAPPPPDPDALAALAATDLGDRARAMTDEIFARPGWVWKDPRVALLLPFWRRVLDPEPAAVVVIRNPLAVARSLNARDGIALEYGLALWERYTRTLLHDLAGMRAFVLDYDRAMADPEGAVRALLPFLADADLVDADADVQTAAEAFVGDHRHQLVTAADLEQDPVVTDEVRALYGLLAGLRGAHSPFPEIDLGEETPRLQVAFVEHKRLSRYEEQVPVLASEIELRDSRIGDLHDEIERRSEQTSQLANEVMALREERASLAARLERLESWWVIRAARRLQRAVARLPRRTQP